MGMGFAPTWLRQVSPPPASQNHFNHWSVYWNIRDCTNLAPERRKHAVTAATTCHCWWIYCGKDWQIGGNHSHFTTSC